MMSSTERPPTTPQAGATIRDRRPPPPRRPAASAADVVDGRPRRRDPDDYPPHGAAGVRAGTRRRARAQYPGVDPAGPRPELSAARRRPGSPPPSGPRGGSLGADRHGPHPCAGGPAGRRTTAPRTREPLRRSRRALSAPARRPAVRRTGPPSGPPGCDVGPWCRPTPPAASTARGTGGPSVCRGRGARLRTSGS